METRRLDHADIRLDWYWIQPDLILIDSQEERLMHGHEKAELWETPEPFDIG